MGVGRVSHDDIIHAHYLMEADVCGLGKESTMRDAFIREVETRFILAEIETVATQRPMALRILDLGCGNGFALSRLCERYPRFAFHGLEFSPELLELALTRQLPNAKIEKGDCRKTVYEPEVFDVVFTERVLINLLDVGDQLEALRQIHRVLKPDSRYLMVECFAEPLKNLNRARRELLLDPIEPPHHNLYLEESILMQMAEMGFEPTEATMPMNYLSTHYFVSRVVHELVRPRDGSIRNTEFVKFLDSALPPAIGDYAPLRFLVFKKAV